MIQKQHYESPSVKILAEEFEENIMSNGIQGSNAIEDSDWNASGWDDLD